MNLRQTGAANTKKLAAKRTNRSTISGNGAPSKKFITGEIRFKSSANVNPSPLDYDARVSAIKSESASFGKKGLGGLASQTKLVGHDSLYKQRGPRRVGPGSYNPQDTRDITHGGPSAAFGRRVGYSVKDNTTPGPSSYQATDTAPHVPLVGGMARSERFTTHREFVRPDPSFLDGMGGPSTRGLNEDIGDYMVQTEKLRGGTSPPKKKRRPAPDRRIPPLNPNVALTQRQVELVDPFIADTRLLGCSERQREIHQRILADQPDASSGSQPSRAFQGTGLDRFGRPVNPVVDRGSVPGPGTYTLAASDKPPKSLSSAAFISSSERFTEKTEAVPGPAFYNPASSGKKSYHVRMGMWL